MKQLLLVIAVTLAFSACTSKGPDVSSIKVNLVTERFEQKLFDTTAPSLTVYLQKLVSSNPSFTNTYLREILGSNPAWSADSTAAFVNTFVQAYRPVYDSAQKVFSNFGPYEAEIRTGLQHVKYYFPGYTLPSKIITYIGPLDGFGDVIAENELLVGLHHHLGKSYSLYKSALVRNTYPDYISARFEPAYISINCMQNIVLDLYPEPETDKPLVNQLIEKGKRLYLLSLLVPDKPEHMLIGYTEDQLKDCYKQEPVIWDMFVKNDLLQSMNKSVLKNYLGESPTTQELGAGSPGNIGAFTGWQIVKKYMQMNPSIKPDELMKIDNEVIFEKTKYKP